MRRSTVCAIVSMLALSVVPTASSAVHTQKVDPFATGWTTIAKASGYCETAADSTKRADAFRCYRGSEQILDPCFSSPSAAGKVRCVAAPWSRKSIEITLTKPLPGAGPGPQTIWAVTLANGGTCAISPETTDTSNGHRIGWICSNGELAQGLHSGASWYALWQPSSGAAWKHVSIRILYR